MSLRCLLGVALLVMGATTLHSATDAVGDSAEPRLGSLVGRFVYDGRPPKPGHLSRFREISLDKPPSREPMTGRFYGDEIAYREYLQQGVRPRTVTDLQVILDIVGTHDDCKIPLMEKKVKTKWLLRAGEEDWLKQCHWEADALWMLCPDGILIDLEREKFEISCSTGRKPATEWRWNSSER